MMWVRKKGGEEGVREEDEQKLSQERLEAEVFRYPGLLSVVLGHLALLHELV